MASADWWHEKAQDLDAPHAKAILDGYKSAFATGIQPALESFKAKIEAYEARTGKTAPQSWLLDQDRLRQLNYQVSNKLSEFKGLVAGEVKDSKNEAVGLATKASGDLVGALSSLPPGVVEEIVGTSADGDTPLGKLLNTFVPDTQAGIRKELVNHAVLGRSPDETAKAIQHQLGIPLTRALTMVRTETARAYTNASLETYRQNPSMVWGWRWLTAEDDKVCEYCGPLDQSVHTLEDDMETHPNCRCAVAPITVDEAINEGLDQIDLSTFDLQGFDEDEAALATGMPSLVDPNDPSTWNKDWFDNLDVMKQVEYLLESGHMGLLGNKTPWEAFQEQLAKYPDWKPGTSWVHLQGTTAGAGMPAPAVGTVAPRVGGREFSDLAEVQRWADAVWYSKGKQGPWDDVTREAIGKYTGYAYDPINNHLRGSAPDPMWDRTVQLIDQALEKHPLPDDVVTFRGTGHGAFGGKDPEIGQVYNEKGYQSTSPHIDSAWQKPVMLEIHVPAGTPGAYVDPISRHSGENELLLGRDLNYVVTGKTTRTWGWRGQTEFWVVEVLPR